MRTFQILVEVYRKFCHGIRRNFFIFRAESETIFNGLRHIKFKDFE